MALSPGTRLGAYEIVGAIGAGGMGEVYRARDTTLDRDVAIKVLPEELAADPERVARFEREAKLLASLSHPNIAAIHGFESRSIVMELVEGPTLAERIAAGPIPVDEAVAIATQVADALDAGHLAGVVHRDLKPANIKVREDGAVKVLDYGLAKALEDDTSTGADPGLSQSPTLTRQGTQIGVILGTAAYMSPEQAKGKRVDKRADVWAFGAVLYEMLTGKRAFEGEDVSDTLAAVLRAEPDLDALPAGTPSSLRTLLRLCLTKDPEERLRDIGDARLSLRGAFDADETPSPAPVARPGFGWALAALALASVAGFVAWSLRTPEPREVVRFVHELPDGLAFGPGRAVSLTRDGRVLLYNADGGLYARRLSDTEASLVSDDRERVYHPVASPDGDWVAYCDAGSGELRKRELSGGAPVTLASVEQCESLHWSVSGAIVHTELGRPGVTRVPALGGAPETISDLRMFDARLLPDGEALLGVVEVDDVPRVVVQAVPDGEPKVLAEGHGARLSSGYLLFVSGETWFAAPFDERSANVGGDAVAIGDARPFVIGRTARYAVSETGTLAYVESRGPGADGPRVLGLADLRETGAPPEMLDVPPALYSSPRLSPDGRRLAVHSGSEVAGDRVVWVYDLTGDRAMRQLTFEGDSHRPVWTPDGERIAFTSDREGTASLYWKPADGSGSAERLTTAADGVMHLPSSWTPDGARLVYIARSRGDADVLAVEPGGGSEPVFQDPDRYHLGPELSPNGRWIAYHTGETLGDQDVYVEPFPPTGARHRISQSGGYWSMWSRSGTELFYRPIAQRVGALRAVEVVAEPRFEFSPERELAPKGFVTVSFQRDYDITPDGTKMLMVYPADFDSRAPRPGPRIQVVVNWLEELKARVPIED